MLKCRLEGVLNFHCVLFLLFQGLSIKTYRRVYFSLSIFCDFREVANSAKIKPTRKIPEIWYTILYLTCLFTDGIVLRVCLADYVMFVYRQVTLFEEFVLLKEYEKREDVLASKVSGKQQEKLDMQVL